MNDNQIAILFVCTGNSCRSQIAEGIFNAKRLKKTIAYSAGISPSRVHPLSIRILDEIGIDIRHHTSDFVDDFIDETFEFVITMSDRAKEQLPDFISSPQIIHWDIDDPYRDFKDDLNQLPIYRETRTIIKKHIDTYIQKYLTETPS